jgi:hypothetical protein
MDEHQIINDRLNLTGQQPTPSGPDGFGKSIGEQRARLAAPVPRNSASARRSKRAGNCAELFQGIKAGMTE